MAACKHCQVTPRKAILQGLSMQNMSVKGQRLSARDIEPIAYALTVSFLPLLCKPRNNCQMCILSDYIIYMIYNNILSFN